MHLGPEFRENGKEYGEMMRNRDSSVAGWRGRGLTGVDQSRDAQSEVGRVEAS